MHSAQLVTFSIFCCFFPSIWQGKNPPFQNIDFFLTIHRQRRQVQVLQRLERMEIIRVAQSSVSGRREDNSSVGTRSRGVRSPGLNSTNATPQSARPLIPTRTATSTPTRASRENILAPLDLTPVDHEAANLKESIVGGSGSSPSAVMEQLKQFFATQGEFNKKLELRRDKLKGRENRTKQVTRLQRICR